MHENDSTIDPTKGQSRIENELLKPVDASDTIDSWRIFKIMAEFVSAFDLLRKYDLAATIFGSARADSHSMRCKEAEDLAAFLAKEKFAVFTGGGGGVMEAANRGAKGAGGDSIGLNIMLPNEQSLNGYTTDSQVFHYFFIRKVALAFAAEVYIFFPGGFGTLDEFFEIATLVQTKKIKPLPIILVGREYWSPLLSWIRTQLYDQYHTISEEDTHIYTLVDSADEAFAAIMEKTRPST